MKASLLSDDQVLGILTPADEFQYWAEIANTSNKLAAKERGAVLPGAVSVTGNGVCKARESLFPGGHGAGGDNAGYTG